MIDFINEYEYNEVVKSMLNTKLFIETSNGEININLK